MDTKHSSGIVPLYEQLLMFWKNYLHIPVLRENWGILWAV